MKVDWVLSDICILCILQTVHQIEVHFVCKASKVSSHTPYEFQRTALDSHANTCCAGSNMAILELK
jgi:hypothetical protein